MRKKVLSAILALIMVTSNVSSKSNKMVLKEYKKFLVNLSQKLDELSSLDSDLEDEEEIITKDITISAVGDCTLGTDTNFGSYGTLPTVFNEHNQDYSYFFSGVYDILSSDDLTIANLETTFTDADVKADKQFNFKGDKSYTNILINGSVEAVNVANNHTYDYLDKGYNDTLDALDEANIPYFGYSNYSILNINGISVGLAGILGWAEGEAKGNTSKAISYLKENGADLIIITYHWGNEREYNQNSIQENIGRFAIDSGADLVIGHHPHVLQGIECYNGKYIVYSLGNFVFGGNKNPLDKDTMIFQETFHYENGILVSTDIEIIPCSLSSRNDLNDYKPIILEEEERTRVLKKIIDSSTNLEYK